MHFPHLRPTQVEPNHAAQLKAQLLAASYHSKQRPVGVLTDLRDDWYFYWFEQKNDKSTLCAAKAARARALSWIRLRCAEFPDKEAGSSRARSPRKGSARAASPRAARPTCPPLSAAVRPPLSLALPAWAGPLRRLWAVTCTRSAPPRKVTPLRVRSAPRKATALSPFLLTRQTLPTIKPARHSLALAALARA